MLKDTRISVSVKKEEEKHTFSFYFVYKKKSANVFYGVKYNVCSEI